MLVQGQADKELIGLVTNKEMFEKQNGKQNRNGMSNGTERETTSNKRL